MVRLMWSTTALALLSVTAATDSIPPSASNTVVDAMPAVVLHGDLNEIQSNNITAEERTLALSKGLSDDARKRSSSSSSSSSSSESQEHLKCVGNFPPPIWKTRKFKQPCGLEDAVQCPCANSRYREISGACNHPNVPNLGRSMTPFNRVTHARYADGVSKVVEKTVSGNMPMPRVISTTLYKDKDRPDKAHSVLHMQWGQFITHDTGFQVGISNADGSPLDCCDESLAEGSDSSSSETSGSHHRSKESSKIAPCYPIVIPNKDPFYSAFGRRCMSFARSIFVQCSSNSGESKGRGLDSDESSSSRSLRRPKHNEINQINHITSVLDASFQYGNNAAASARLRAFEDGLMKTRKVTIPCDKDGGGSSHHHEHRGDSGSQDGSSSKESSCPEKRCSRKQRRSSEEKSSSEEGSKQVEVGEFPPLESPPFQACIPEAKRCYDFGDLRVSSHMWSACLAVVFLREHNRIARRLKDLHPDWCDETLFQETRRIFIAIFQCITYKFYLPKVIGKNIMKRMHLMVTPNRKGKYDKKVNPSTLNEFTTGAFRFPHSQIDGIVELQGEGRCPYKKFNLSDNFLNPSRVEIGQTLISVIRGMTKQSTQKVDRFFNSEITGQLFPNTKHFGDDLVSKDIQRGRDHGIPSYNDMRKICGLRKAVDFEDLKDVMSKDSIHYLKTFYRSVNDVEFYVGGGLEEHCVDGDDSAIVGPTFGCLIAEQFFRYKKGDRYFFSHVEGPGAFTEAQYKAIREVTLGSILCHNVHGLEHMQLDPFMPVSKSNPLLNCKDLQPLAMKPWEDYQPGPNCPLLPVKGTPKP